jgi:multimeric flavodoxin WrbA
MKILGIVGSPRKGGNTEILVEEALAATREAGAQTEIILLADKNIAGCDGCDSCVETHVCKIKDDMQSIYPQLEAADAIIFGSPVYFGGVTSQAKALIDRTYVFLRDKRLKGKVVAPIVALRRIGGRQTRTLLYDYFINQGTIVTRGAIGYGRQKGEVREGVGGFHGFSALEEARNAGKEVVQMLQRLSRP